MAREFFVNKLRDHENESSGLLRFGLKVGRVSASGFEPRVRELVDDNPRLQMCMEVLLMGRAAMMAQLSTLHRGLLRVTAIDDPARLRRSCDIDAHLGLTPMRFQSGGTKPEAASADLVMRLRDRHCSPPLM